MATGVKNWCRFTYTDFIVEKNSTFALNQI